MIVLNNISYAYNKKSANEKIVLNGLSLSIYDNEFLGIIGTNGSGKTTLIKHLNGLLQADSGELYLDGENIYEAKYGYKKLLKKVGLVFQYPEKQLFEKTVIDDVCFGLRKRGTGKDDAVKAATVMLKMLGIDEDKYYISPFELSGGQRRLVSIAGVLIMEPSILVLDEPGAGLDPITRHRIFEILKKYKIEKNCSVVVVSHEMEDVAEFCDRVIYINNGSVCAEGTPQAVFNSETFRQDKACQAPEVNRALRLAVDSGFPAIDLVCTVDEAEQLLLDVLKNKRSCNA